MTQLQIQQARRNSNVVMYAPWLGSVEDSHGRLFTSSGEKPRTIQIRIKIVKLKICKSKVKLIKRKYVQGYKCRVCHKWVKHDWKLSSLRKCPKCGKISYHGKQVLQKTTKLYERTTKHYKILLKYVEPSRVGKPGLTVTRYSEPPPKSNAIKEVPAVKRRKHMKRAEYTGSAEASRAGKQSWETRRQHGWKPKAQRLFAVAANNNATLLRFLMSRTCFTINKATEIRAISETTSPIQTYFSQ